MPDTALFVDRHPHDANLAFPRADDSGSSADQARAPVLQETPRRATISSVGYPRDADDPVTISDIGPSIIASAANGGGTNDRGIRARLRPAAS